MGRPVTVLGEKLQGKTIRIASGAALSNDVYVGGEDIVGIRMPAVWDAANLTAQISEDNLTYRELVDSAGNNVVVATGPAANEWITLDSTLLRGFKYMKIRSGTAAVPVNQTGDRDLMVILESP